MYNSHEYASRHLPSHHDIRPKPCIPKPVASNAAPFNCPRIAKEKPVQNSVNERPELLFGEAKQDERVSMNYHVSATRIEDIIKSVSALTQNTGSSDVKVNVNIFYQPVFNLDRNSLPENQKQACIPNYQTLTPVLEASSPLIHDATESINSLDSPLKVKIEPCTAEVLDKAASLLSQEEKEVVSSDRSSFKLSNSQHSQKICVKALPKPISVNKLSLIHI